MSSAYSSPEETLAISFDDILHAADRLKGKTQPTPLIKSPVIDLMTGKDIWFKPECTQKVGAFKYRGAYNRLSAMSAGERARGVVAYSSGNHAQGVSRAAKELGMSAIIVMPSDAPTIKVSGVKRDGAEIVFYNRLTESREALAEEISQRDGRIVVPSFDDPHIIAGQGTTGLEISIEAATRGIELDAVIVPMGGGGLCAGTAMAIKNQSQDIMIFGAEPEGYNDHQISIRHGQRTAYVNPPKTICDAIMTPIPGELTFPINKAYVSDVFCVTDEECLMSMAIVKKELDLIVEPGGIVGLAAILKGELSKSKCKSICVVLSGGNVDAAVVDMAFDQFHGAFHSIITKY